MTSIKQRVQASLAMKRYQSELHAHEQYDRAMSNPAFIEIEAEYREAAKNCALYGKKEELNAAAKKRDDFLFSIGLNSRSFDAFYCKECRDKGTVNGMQCKCVKEEYSRFLLANGINPSMTFEHSAHSPQNNSVFSYCMEYSEGKAVKPNILLIGKGGTGKTYLANAIGNALTERGCEVAFFTAFDLNLLLLKIHLSNLNERFELLHSIISPQYLIVDDLGTEEQHKVTISYLYNLINQRIVNLKNTVITSNLHPEAILGIYGERIMSRITDKNITYIAALSGANQRHKK